MEKAHPRYLRPGRPISVSAVPFGPGIDIWRSCRFIGSLMRSLCLLPGGLRRFVPCSIGANHCRLRHIGWEKCGHGLTSRPRESASELFLNELLSLFRYPSRSGRALLNGTLPLRYCSTRFACMTPSWRLPASGQVGRLVAAYPDSAGDCRGEVFALRVPLVSKSSPVRKRFRLNRKPPAHLVGISAHSRLHVYGRDCVRWGFQVFLCLITQGGDVIMLMGALFMSMTELGWGNFPGFCAGPRLQVRTPFN